MQRAKGPTFEAIKSFHLPNQSTDTLRVQGRRSFVQVLCQGGVTLIRKRVIFRVAKIKSLFLQQVKGGNCLVFKFFIYFLFSFFFNHLCLGQLLFLLPGTGFYFPFFPLPLPFKKIK